jgi:hypothetical protein
LDTISRADSLLEEYESDGTDAREERERREAWDRFHDIVRRFNDTGEDRDFDGWSDQSEFTTTTCPDTPISEGGTTDYSSCTCGDSEGTRSVGPTPYVVEF